MGIRRDDKYETNSPKWLTTRIKLSALWCSYKDNDINKLNLIMKWTTKNTTLPKSVPKSNIKRQSRHTHTHQHTHQYTNTFIIQWPKAKGQKDNDEQNTM